MKNNQKCICIVFSNSELKNGATRSMLDLLERWNKESKYRFICIVREEGLLKKTIEEMGVRCYVCNYRGVRYDISDRRLMTICRNLVRCVLMFFERVISVNKAMRMLCKEDIVCVYSNTGAIYFGSWLSQKMGVKHIWHIREFGEEDQNSKHLWGKRYFIKRLNQSDNLIFISNSIKMKYENYIVDKTKINMFYNDLSPNNICKQSRNKDVNKFNVLIAGTIIEGKGQFDVVQAIEELNRRDIPAFLYIAGRDEGIYSEKIHKLCEKT